MLSKKIDLERNRPLWGKRQAFFPPIFFSSCQSWWKVCTIFAETLRQVSYYTTMVLKTTQHTHLGFFFFAILSAYVYVGYFANTKVHGYVIILNDSCQNSAVCWTGAREGQSTAQEKRERLSEAFWSDTNVISWCHVLSALLFTSPL